MNIVLIGMRGSGKTTTARLLSRRLGIPVADMDKLLAEKVGMSIADFVEQNGWDAFRDAEEEIAQEVSKNDNTIIATGGGAILREENRAALHTNGKLFYLRAPVDTLFARIGDDPSRPSLTTKQSRKEEMATLLSERAAIYESTADAIIDTQNKTVQEVVEEIQKTL